MPNRATMASRPARPPWEDLLRGALRREGAAGGPGDTTMGRPGWTTISIPNELHDDLKRHVPRRARSVQAYVAQWARIGSVIDDLRNTDNDLAAAVDRVMRALKEEL